MAQALASLLASCSRQVSSLEYGRYANTIGLYCRIQGPRAKIAEKQLAATYPELAIERLDDNAIRWPTSSRTYMTELWLARDVLPIQTCDAFEDRLSRELNDPIAGLLAILATSNDAAIWSHAAIELHPAPQRRVLAARRVLDRYYTTPLHRHYRRGRWFLSWATSPRWSRRFLALTFASLAYGWRAGPQPIESKAAYAKLDQPLFTARIRLSAAADTDARARRQLAQLAAAFAPYTINSNASFRVVRDGVNRRGSLLSVDELAVLWHLPTSGVKTERLQQTLSRDFEPPAVLPNASERGTVVLGRTKFRRRSELVAIREDAAETCSVASPLRKLPSQYLAIVDRHVYIAGGDADVGVAGGVTDLRRPGRG